jgi:gamma-glutamyltranspeptidase
MAGGSYINATIDHEAGVLHGGADPRGEGLALGT